MGIVIRGEANSGNVRGIGESSSVTSVEGVWRWRIGPGERVGEESRREKQGRTERRGETESSPLEENEPLPDRGDRKPFMSESGPCSRHAPHDTDQIT